MITISKQDNGVLFTFENSDKYLYGNGTIEVPFNSLSIIADESDMITLRKSASNDIFLSARYDTDFGYRSKDDAIDDLKGMLFAETGGGGSGSGITSGEVQTMIDNSLEDYYTDDEVDAALSGKASVSDVTALQNEVATKAEMSAVTAVANDVQTVSGQVATKVATSDFNTYTAATETALNGKADTSAVTAVSDALTAHTANTSVHVTSEEKTTWNNKSDFSGDYNDLTNKPTIPTVPTNISDFTNDAGYITSADITGKADTSAVTAAIDAATSGKVDTSAITSAITSGSTDAEIPTAKAVYDAIPTGGGATYSAGQGISIDTANTISFAVPIYSGATGNVFHPTYNNNSILIGNTNNRASFTSVAGGNACTGQNFSFTYGQTNNATGSTSIALGNRVNATNDREAAFGSYNVSNKANTTFGDSGNTLFSVGNGTSSARHNAFEVRQNGDIYITSGNTDIKLQDHLGGGGGGGVTVDPTLDSGSTNPVANSAITQALENKLDASAYTPTDLSEYWTSAQTQSAIDGVNNALTAHTANTTVHVTSVEKDAWNAKANIDHVTQSEYDAMVTAGTLDSNTMYIIDDAVPFDPSTKVDTSAITTAITSGSTDAQVPSAKAVYDAIPTGGGATYSAGTNISIDTANTINCTIPFDYNTGYDRYNLGTGITNASYSLHSIAIGSNVTLKGNDGVAIGRKATITGTSTNAVVIGVENQAKKSGSVVIGNNSTTDVSQGVAIGTNVYVTGTTKTNINNQIWADTNNQVYIKDKTNTTDVCIQDAIAALGGLKLVKLTQNEYDQLATKDNDTLYIISNVVS